MKCVTSVPNSSYPQGSHIKVAGAAEWADTTVFPLSTHRSSSRRLASSCGETRNYVRMIEECMPAIVAGDNTIGSYAPHLSLRCLDIHACHLRLVHRDVEAFQGAVPVEEGLQRVLVLDLPNVDQLQTGRPVENLPRCRERQGKLFALRRGIGVFLLSR